MSNVTPNNKPGMGKVGNVIFIVLGQSSQALGFGAIALFLPLIRQDMDISFTQAGAFAAMTTIVYAILQVPAGYLGDRFDAKKLFIIGLLGVNVCSMLFATLTNYEILLAVQGLSGAFRALLFGPGIVLITSQFRPDQRATAMGIFVAGGMSSNILLNLVGPFLVGPLGWKNLLIIFSVSALTVAILYWFLGSSVKRDVDHQAPKLTELPALMKHPIVWLTSVIQFVRLAVVTGLSFWLPSIMVEDKGFSLVTTGIIVAIGAAVVAPANIFGGIVRTDSSDHFIIGLSMVFLALTIAALTVVRSQVLVIVVVIVNSIFLQLYFGPLFAVPMNYIKGSSAGLLSGFGNLWANIGGFAASLTMGYVKETTGSFNIALFYLVALCGVGLMATLAIWRLPSTPSAGKETVSPDSDDEGLADVTLGLPSTGVSHND